jgi:hypothetical protein
MEIQSETIVLRAPDPISIHTDPDPDCPTGVTTTIAFDYQIFDAWASRNPTASFHVPFEDGSPSPCIISAGLYLEEKQKMV